MLVGSGKKKQKPVADTSVPAASSADNDVYYISHGKEEDQSTSKILF